MAGQTLGDVLRRIGRQAGLQGVLTLTDAQLLERFAYGRDEPAFAALMVRHGPMVLGVCRRLLNDAGQAEDAFQAAFLVLARKAGAIQRRPLLNAWLYGVAYKVAARLRGRAWRREAREKPAADLTHLPAGAAPEVSDLSPALHEEVQRLPEKYRNPVVLCYLEGMTHEQAAARLRWPVGTVKGRLARARDMLRSRLARRGLAPCEGALGPALLVTPATASPALVDATIRAGGLYAGGNATAGGLVAGRVVALTNGVLRTMMLTKLKIAAATILALALLGGVGRYAYLAQAGPEDAPKPGARAADKPAAGDQGKDDKVAIQGTWQVTGLEMQGKEAPDNDETKAMKSGKWVVTADKITVSVPGKDEHTVSFKLDPTKKPKELDITPLDGPENEKGKVAPGLYSLDGDVLKICIPPPGPNPSRPTELGTKAGGESMLITLKRQPPAKDKKEDNPAGGREGRHEGHSRRLAGR